MQITMSQIAVLIKNKIHTYSFRHVMGYRAETLRLMRALYDGKI